MIETKRLILRRWEPDDAEDMYEYAKDPVVGPIAGWPVHKSVEDSRNVIENVMTGKESYCICEKETNHVIGSIELKRHTNFLTREMFEEEKRSKIFVNSEDAMSVLNVDQFKRHRCSAFHRIFVSTGGTEAAVAAKRDKFKFSTVRTAIHGATKRRITTVDHLFDIFHLSRSGMKSIFNFFIIVGKDSL